jgi:hypothetical protein
VADENCGPHSDALAQLPSELVAGHPRHPHVSHEQVERALFAALAFISEIRSLLAARPCKRLTAGFAAIID